MKRLNSVVIASPFQITLIDTEIDVIEHSWNSLEVSH